MNSERIIGTLQAAAGSTQKMQQASTAAAQNEVCFLLTQNTGDRRQHRCQYAHCKN